MKSSQLYVLKISGKILAQKDQLTSVLKIIKDLRDQSHKVVLVYGGGIQVDQMSKKLGLQVQKKNGRRITTVQDLEIVKMIYGGTLNLNILSEMKKLGLKGLRLSGADGDWMKVHLRPKEPIDFGFVGDIEEIDPELIHSFLDQDLTPLIPPLSITHDSFIVNINADTMACEIAGALKADKLIFLSDVSGIIHKEEVLSDVSISKAEDLIHQGITTGGMQVKLHNAIQALKKGLQNVHIIQVSDLSSLFRGMQVGTTIHA